MQTTDSYKTAITRKALSVPTARLLKAGLLRGDILDYGAGKGFDARAIGASSYDPHFAPKKPATKFDTIICNYVLNVVDESTQSEIVSEILSHMKKDARAYITVRRDLPKQGAPGRGCYQRQAHLLLGSNVKILWETTAYCTYVIGFNLNM